MPVHPGNLTSAYRRIWPEANYTGHDWDDVLGMYYAKARFYDPAAKRFVAMDPVKGNVTDPLSLVSYLYCVDNPLKYVDPMGLSVMPIGGLTPVNNLGTDKVAEAIKNSYNTSITSAKEAINSITKHFTDEDRAGHVMMGIAVSMAKAMLDNAELPILFVLDLVNSLTKSKFTMEYYERYMKGSDALVAKIAENVVYEDSFYFGKMLGDIGLMGLGIGVGLKGIVEILSGLGIGFSGGAGGAALVASGAGAPAGVGLIAGSLTEAGVLIAEGGVSLSIGLALAKTGASEFGKDKEQFDYFKKQKCEEKTSTSAETAAQFEEKISHLSGGDRVAAILEKASQVAKEKGFNKNYQLSKINGRNIYTDNKTGRHYSVDTLHGRFEYYDSRGRHLGELNFDFVQTKPADSSGAHNIKIS